MIQKAGTVPETYHQAVEYAGKLLPFNESYTLVGSVLDVALDQLVAHGETPISSQLGQAVAEAVERRSSGEPLAYIRGWHEFYGRRFVVDQSVLVPRPETEILVELALGMCMRLRRDFQASGPLQLLDCGTGSGAIAVTLACEINQPEAIRVMASDISYKALEIAQTNGMAHNADVIWMCGDLLSSIASDSLHLIVANLPYIAAEDPVLKDDGVRYEPVQALVGGDKGSELIAELISSVKRVLKPGGAMLLEHGSEQGGEVRAMLEDSGMLAHTIADLAGLERATLAFYDPD